MLNFHCSTFTRSNNFGYPLRVCLFLPTDCMGNHNAPIRMKPMLLYGLTSTPLPPHKVITLGILRVYNSFYTHTAWETINTLTGCIQLYEPFFLY